MFSRNGADKNERKKLPLWYRAVSLVLTVAAIAAVCFCVVLVLVAKAGEDGREVFGYVILKVQSGSMEPTLSAGDVILCDAYEGGDISVGDVVTFTAPRGAYAGMLITHRVTEIVTEDGEEVGFRTKSDAADGTDTWTLTRDDIVGVYERKMPVVTSVSGFMGSAGGMMLVIGLPIILLVVVLLADGALSRYLAAKADGKGSAEEKGE